MHSHAINDRHAHTPCSITTWLHRSSSSSSFIMFPCSSVVELLCRLIKGLDAVAVVESPEASSSTLQACKLKEIKCQLERLQLKLIKEMYCKEDNAMEQLRHLAGCLDELAAAAGQDSQCGFSTLKSLEKVEAAVHRTLNVVADKDLYTLCGSENERKEGPWGPRLGFDWDIGSFHDIKTLNVSADDRINSIQIEYNFDCRKYKTPRIGGEGGTLHQIELGENEHITSIRGTYDTISLTKLEIVTNKNSYSFGKGCGGSVFPPCQLPCDCKVVGFFGRAASHVNAIGVYLEKTDDSPNKRLCASCLCQSGTMPISKYSPCHVCS